MLGDALGQTVKTVIHGMPEVIHVVERLMSFLTFDEAQFLVLGQKAVFGVVRKALPAILSQ